MLVLALSPKPGSGLTLAQVRLLAENDMRAALVAQPHVANVEVFGGYEPTLRVEFDPLKLARYGLSQAQFQDLLAKIDRDWPLGTVQSAGAATTLTIYGERAEAERLRLLPLAPGLTLGDVAQVEFAGARTLIRLSRTTADRPSPWRSSARRAARWLRPSPMRRQSCRT